MNIVSTFHPTPSIGTSIAPSSPPQLDRLISLLHTHRGHPAGEIDRFLADHPDSVVGHCLRAAFIVRDEQIEARPALAASIAALEGVAPGQRTGHRHARAARAWLEGDSATALERYGAIVVDRPNDVLALVAAHALDFRLGRRRMLRDRIARVLPEWNASMPGYASVLAMYAFGLEENGEYRRAEKLARRALALDEGHPGAIHTIAHVMEMQARAREGLAFLAATESAWREGTGFSLHLAWHRALFQLDVDDTSAALATYDERIAPACNSGATALIDASALLWRLRLRSIDVTARWRQLADRWEIRMPAARRPFHAVHAMMAFSAADRLVPATRLLDALRRSDASAMSTPEESLALPLCEALNAFARADYEASIRLLERVRQLARHCGGSVAQCDVIHLMFTEAALRARKARLAHALVAERAAWKPASFFNRLLRQRAAMLMPAQMPSLG